MSAVTLGGFRHSFVSQFGQTVIVSFHSANQTSPTSLQPPLAAEHPTPPGCMEEGAPSSTCSPAPLSCPGCTEGGPGSSLRQPHRPPPRTQQWHQDTPVGCPGTLHKMEERSSACRGEGTQLKKSCFVYSVRCQINQVACPAMCPCYRFLCSPHHCLYKKYFFSMFSTLCQTFKISFPDQ